MTTRILFDQLDIFYDYWDMANYLEQGHFYTDRWSVISCRAVKVGDQVYFLDNWMEKDECGIFARGTIVAAEEDEQKRFLDADYARLSPAYCPYYEADDEIEAEDGSEVLFVRFELDSAVRDRSDTLQLKELKNLPAAKGLKYNPKQSGEAFPGKFSALLDEQWQAHIEKLRGTNRVVIKGGIKNQESG